MRLLAWSASTTWSGPADQRLPAAGSWFPGCLRTGGLCFYRRLTASLSAARGILLTGWAITGARVRSEVAHAASWRDGHGGVRRGDGNTGSVLCRSNTRMGVTCTFAGMMGAVVVGLPGAAQDRLPADACRVLRLAVWRSAATGPEMSGSRIWAFGLTGSNSGERNRMMPMRGPQWHSSRTLPKTAVQMDLAATGRPIPSRDTPFVAVDQPRCGNRPPDAQPHCLNFRSPSADIGLTSEPSALSRQCD
jgi:hypothetical protein